jgi:hypothetical protein
MLKRPVIGLVLHRQLLTSLLLLEAALPETMAAQVLVDIVVRSRENRLAVAHPQSLRSQLPWRQITP